MPDPEEIFENTVEISIGNFITDTGSFYFYRNSVGSKLAGQTNY